MNKVGKEGIKVLQLNIGKRVLSHDLMMNWLQNEKEEWIICLQEPSFTRYGVSKMCKGYGAYWSTSACCENKRPRAMIIAPKCMNGYLVSQHSHVDCVIVRFEEYNFSLASVYCAVDINIQQSLEGVMQERQVAKNVIVCLDTNAYHYEWGSSQQQIKDWRRRTRGECLLDMFEESNIIICNETPHSPTFVRFGEKGNYSHIDVTASTIEMIDKIKNWKVGGTSFMTDHKCITFEIGKKEGKRSIDRKEREGVPWKKPTDRMKRVIEEVLLGQTRYKRRIQDREDVDEFIRKHTEEINRLLQSLYKRKGEGKVAIYWWSKAVALAHKKLKIARRRLRRYKYKNLRQEFNECRRNFRRAAFKAKTEAWRKFTSEITDPWDGLIKIIRSMDAGRIQSKTLADLQGIYANDITQTLMILGSQFYPPPFQMSAHHNEVKKYVKSQLQDVSAGPEITKEELCWALSFMTKATAPGFDNVTNLVLQILAKKGKFGKQYLSLFNVCLKSVHFPETWKKARIVLIPKLTTEKDTVKAFRPISLTSVFSKLFERILLNRLLHYLYKSGRMVENQHAYCKGRSTLTALYAMFNVVQSIFYKKGGGVCVVVFLDISGAFDRTWHDGILCKLLQYQVPKYMVAIIRAFLYERRAIFEESGVQHEVELQQGCPQGGVLSPVLWNVLFNEMLGIPIDQGQSRGNVAKIVGYADDAALVCKARTVEEASGILNVHLEKIRKWAGEHRVNFNTSKLAVLTISNRKASPPPAKVYYDSILIKEVTHYKYLGLIVDNKVTWAAHINEVVKRLGKVTRSLRGLAREEWGLKLTIFKTLYHTIFYPIMTYGICIWGWRAWFKGVCGRFDKEIRKFGLVATQCLKSTANVYIQNLLGTQDFAAILQHEVLSKSVKQLHVLDTDRKQVYETYCRTRTREIPQCMDHHFAMCRRGNENNICDLRLDDESVIYDTHPASWGRTECVVENEFCAVRKGSDELGWVVYTDASACSYGLSWCFISYHHGFATKNEYGALTQCTVFEAEAFAVLKAIEYIQKNESIDKKEVVEIRTDCQALVRVLEKYVHSDYLLHLIKAELRKAQLVDKKVLIRWIPGHKGILGNETADKIAKKAVDSGWVEEMRKTKQIFRKMCKDRVERGMVNTWKTFESRSIRAFLPTLQDVRKFVKSSPSGALCQIVSGHSRLNEFLCMKLGVISSAQCACGQEKETVMHFICECQLYDDLRKEIWPFFQAEYSCISCDWKKVQEFVFRTERFRGTMRNSCTKSADTCV